MSVTPTTGTHPVPLPTAGLAGQIAFAFHWAHHFAAEAGWTIPPPQRRPYATLWLILEGDLHVDSGVEADSLGPGCLVTWPPDAVRWAENRTARPVVLYTMAFNLRVWGELDFFRLYRVPTFHQVSHLKDLTEPFSALVDELGTHGEAVTLVAEGWARVLVGRWLSSLEAAGQLRPAEEVDERLARILAAIESDLAGDWSLQRLADVMRLSKVRMREVFVRGVGLPPMRYVAMRRLAHAKSLLVDTDLTAAEIATRCGFQDPGYFSRMFHRVAGMQPSVYRARARFGRE
jgi:AraC-like DNA-binding protein